MLKKVFVYGNVIISSLIIASLELVSNKVINTKICDNAVSGYMYHSMDEVKNILNKKYSAYDNLAIEIREKYPALSIKNIDQYKIKKAYNSFWWKHDLNHDNERDDNDIIGKNSGICQPVAATMALQYMVDYNYLSYSSNLTNEISLKFALFYDVTYYYIQQGWEGGGALTTMCYKSLNKFFDEKDSRYVATLNWNNFLDNLKNSYNKGLPSIGHMSDFNNEYHAVSVCGYFNARTSYYDYGVSSSKIIKDNYYIIVNDGWFDATQSDNSETEYFTNYCYVSLDNFYALTSINYR